MAWQFAVFSHGSVAALLLAAAATPADAIRRSGLVETSGGEELPQAVRQQNTPESLSTSAVVSVVAAAKPAASGRAVDVTGPAVTTESVWLQEDTPESLSAAAVVAMAAAAKPAASKLAVDIAGPAVSTEASLLQHLSQAVASAAAVARRAKNVGVVTLLLVFVVGFLASVAVGSFYAGRRSRRARATSNDDETMQPSATRRVFFPEFTLEETVTYQETIASTAETGKTPPTK